ncbi:DNA methyltransferase [Serpentinicella sp. ANB-PHB4]|uniref:DNA methyltransferase n=1 Tax=Serpentinicella sp. ANB-PHB4 TaxID=3074076 RepID=UPI002862FE4A|nr:DNA methyltransferase [Serpentinicella sp. ANB-PHB4]MDR5659867.1 DNA methyltransferase [Serpentinicella sp. ANB-PHB4]
MLLDSIEKYGIYKDEKLKKAVYELEKKYKIVNEIDYFNQLVNFSKNKNIPYHGWFKYREGYSFTLISELIRRSQISKDEFVFDPFCGSGTTVVEAALKGYSGCGIDINPMSAFISEIKCRSYSDDEINHLLQLKDYFISNYPDKEASIDYLEKYGDVKKFFSQENYSNLLRIRELIDAILSSKGKKIFEFFLCAYISIIEDVSDRKRDGNGLKTQTSKVDNVLDVYLEKIALMLNDITKNRIEEGVNAKLEFGNAMELSKIVRKYEGISNKELGAIMYSPPYANSFDYFESYKMEIILADYASNMKGISSYRKQAVESFIGRNEKREKARELINWMAEEIELAIPEKETLTGKRDSRTRKVPKMIRGYFTDMEKVISESSDVLKSGKKCYIVVDQSAYLGRLVPTDLFFAAIAEDYNFKVSEIIICRAAKTSGQQIQKYPYLRNCLRESIVVLEKI